MTFEITSSQKTICFTLNAFKKVGVSILKELSLERMRTYMVKNIDYNNDCKIGEWYPGT
jgi:hypothetical protein